MKFTKKALVAMLTTFVLFVSLFAVSTPTTVHAAKKTKKVTLMVGEELSVFPIGGTLKKVKSSKKKVCAVKKKSGAAILKAKKAGTAKITLKTTGGKLYYKVKVIKNPFKVSVSPMKDGNVVAVKNTSSLFINWVTVQLTYCDSMGNPLNQTTRSIYYLGKGQTGYDYAANSGATIDYSKTKYKVVEWKRYPDYKSKSYASKVNVNHFKGLSTYGSDVLKFNASTNYSGKGTILVAQDVFVYDKVGNIIKVISDTTSLYSTKSVYTDDYGTSLPDGWASYRVVSTRVYLQTY
jgi:hypothetical protein